METAEEMYREHYPSGNVQQKDTIILMEKYAEQYKKEIEKLKKQVAFFNKAGINLVEEKKLLSVCEKLFYNGKRNE